MKDTFYPEEYCPYYHKVVFLNENGQKLVKGFDSPYLAYKFAKRGEKSRRTTLISYPSLR